jgi:hypothetical protein
MVNAVFDRKDLGFMGRGLRNGLFFIVVNLNYSINEADDL